MTAREITITNWGELYENAESRKRKKLAWVPVPNHHDSVGYCRLIARPDGVELFAAWILILQVASKCPERGFLGSSDGRPYGAAELSVKTRAPEELFVRALPVLEKLGWITAKPPFPETPAESPEVPARPPEVPARHDPTPSLKERKNERNERNEPPTPNKVGGLIPENLRGDIFEKLWTEWKQHRREIRKPLTPTSEAKQLKRLSEMGMARAIKAVENTIEKGWQGVREPDPDEKTAPPGNATPDFEIGELQKKTAQLLEGES